MELFDSVHDLENEITLTKTTKRQNNNKKNET